MWSRKLLSAFRIRIFKIVIRYNNDKFPTHIVLSPLDFLSRLSSLIPQPRVHLTRFHGVFAPHFKYRALITPKSRSSEELSEVKKENTKSYSIGWAKRLKSVFGIDIQTCSKCGEKVRVISAIEEVQVIQRILTHLGKDYRIPKLYPLRGPPEINENFITV